MTARRTSSRRSSRSWRRRSRIASSSATSSTCAPRRGGEALQEGADSFQELDARQRREGRPAARARHRRPQRRQLAKAATSETSTSSTSTSATAQKILIDITAAQRNQLDQAIAGRRSRSRSRRRTSSSPTKSTSSGRSTASTGATSSASTARRSPRSAGGNAMNRVLSFWQSSSSRCLFARRRLVPGADVAARRVARRRAASASPTRRRRRSTRARAALAARRPSHGQGSRRCHFHSARSADLKKRDQQIEAEHADEQMLAGIRDERQTALKQRARALLVTEIQSLETSSSTTRQRGPGPPELAPAPRRGLRRARERRVPREDAGRDRARRAEEDEPARGAAAAGDRELAQDDDGARPQGGQQVLHHARQRLLGQPSTTFPPNPPPAYPQLDEVFYYLAYEYEQANDNANARRVYFDLITKTPNSKYIPNAYLAFGELFFNEAQGDPSKWEPAEQAYVKVIRYPPPDNKVYGYAWYKLAYVFWNEGDFAKRSTRSRRRSTTASQFAQLPNATKLAESARRTSSRSTRSRATRPPPTTSSTTSRATSGSNDKTFKMMDDLGQNYLDTGHYPEAIALYKDLMARDRGERQGLRLPGAHHRSDDGDEVRQQGRHHQRARQPVQALRRVQGGEPHGGGEAGVREQDRGAPRPRPRWRGTSRPSAPQGQRGTGDPKTMDLAAHLYKKVAETWNADGVLEVRVPAHRQGRLADHLQDQVRHGRPPLLPARAGPSAVRRSTRSSPENPKAPEAAEAAYAAVLCYQNIYVEQHAKGADKKGIGQPAWRRQRTSRRTSDDKCRAEGLHRRPEGDDPPSTGTFATSSPARATPTGRSSSSRSSTRAPHLLRGAALGRGGGLLPRHRDEPRRQRRRHLRRAALPREHQRARASTARRTALVLRRHGHRRAEVHRPLLHRRQAREERGAVHDRSPRCSATSSASRRRSIVEEADKGGNNALELYEKGGNAYFELWDKYGETPLRANQPPQCEKLDEIVDNAARAFQAGHLVARPSARAWCS